MQENCINIVTYNSLWPEEFEREKQQLNAVLKECRFYHIGSTSIPGCLAKPIIDILGVVSDVTEVDGYNASLANLGYQPLGEYGMEQRRFFRKRTGTAVNVHIFEETDPEVERHLRFREYLKRYPEKKKHYEAVKQELKENTLDQYTLGKNPFIRKIDQAAIREFPTKIDNFPPQRKKKKWAQKEILKAAEVNLHLFFTYFTKYLPEVEIVQESAIQFVITPIADDTFNVVFNAHFTEANYVTKIQEVVQRFGALPFSWWIGPQDEPPNLAKRLVQEGLKLKNTNVGMHFFLDSYEPSSKPTPLTIQPLRNFSQWPDFAKVFVAIGGSSVAYEQIYSQLPAALYSARASCEIYIGYVDAKPVVTGILLLHANVAGVYYIMTIPEARKQGYATCMMHHVLSRAKTLGYHLSILQASPEGKSLYERLGFQSHTVYQEYGT